MVGSLATPRALELLRTVPLLAGLDKRHLRTLADSAAERTFKAGEFIVREGEKGLGFYLVVEGQAEVERAGRPVATLGTGQFFGEMALLDDEPRTASVRAKGPVRCLVLSTWEFWGSVGKDPEALRTLLQDTVRRLRGSEPALGD